MAVLDWIIANIDDVPRVTGSGNEVHMNCPYCGEIRHRYYVNLVSGATHCHNCGWSPTVIGLIQFVEGVSWTRASKIFADVKGNMILPERLSQDTLANIFMGDLRHDLDKRAIPLPDEYSVINPTTENLAVKRAVKYLHKRGITDKQIVDTKMGYCFDGDYSGRVIIPIMEQGELRFWIARSIDPEAKLKEKSPSDSEWNISKSEVIFNIDKAAKLYHSVVLCEGIFDALAFSGIGASLLGKSLYTAQRNILLDYRELLKDGVYIALDADAKDNATDIAEQLSEFFQVYIINIPKELDDPNNCLRVKGRDYVLSLIGQAEEYSEFSGIRRKLG